MSKGTELTKGCKECRIIRRVLSTNFHTSGVAISNGDFRALIEGYICSASSLSIHLEP